MPSGSCSRRNARSFHVAGSASRAATRLHQRPPSGSGRYGLGISTPTSRPMRLRSRSASQRHAHIVPIRIGMPTSVIAVPKPVEIAVTRKLNSATPSGSASRRYAMRAYVRPSRIGRTSRSMASTLRGWRRVVHTGTRTFAQDARDPVAERFLIEAAHLARPLRGLVGCPGEAHHRQVGAAGYGGGPPALDALVHRHPIVVLPEEG